MHRPPVHAATAVLGASVTTLASFIMHAPPAVRRPRVSPLGLTATTLACALRVTTAQAQLPTAPDGQALTATHATAPLEQTVFGGSLGRSAYATSAKAYAAIAVGRQTQAEMQLLSLGTRVFHENNHEVIRKAWTIGPSFVASGHLSATWHAFAKLGVHYLRSESSGLSAYAAGPGHSDLRLGAGIGAVWAFSPRLPAMGLRCEFENIGGTLGNVTTLGLQWRW